MIEDQGFIAVIVLTVMITVDYAKTTKQMAAVLYGSVTLPICHFLWRIIIGIIEVWKRNRTLRRTIEQLSISRGNSVGTEVPFTPQRTVGNWVHVCQFTPEVTSEVLNEIVSLLS
jgi:hypothetical protein